MVRAIAMWWMGVVTERFFDLGVRAKGRAAGALAALACALALAACESDSASDDPKAVASRARELPFLSDVPIVLTTREAHTREAVGVSDETLEMYRGVHGRLGFFDPSFDVRSALGVESESSLAYYRASTKTITLIGEVSSDVLVHELVHALQDQHFDLTAVDEAASSTDESLARRAVTEGDAELAQLRTLVWAKGYYPTDVLADALKFSSVHELSEKTLGQSRIPVFFLNYNAFVYYYGAGFVGHEVGLPFGQWNTERTNAIFRGAFPASTQELLRREFDSPVDPIVEVGLSELPRSLGDRLHVRWRDRLGQWMIYLLLRSTTIADRAWTLADGWDGDQLLVLDDANDRHVGIVWTTAWDSPELAASFASALATIHATFDGEGHLSDARDGERMYLEQRGDKVVFVKNLPDADMLAIARQAFGEPQFKPAFAYLPRIRVPELR